MTTKNPIQKGATIALRAAEAIGEATSEVTTDPGIRAGANAAAALVRIIKGIFDRHGSAGALEAKKLLDKLYEEGPKGITDAELAEDDAALAREIEGWFAK